SIVHPFRSVAKAIVKSHLRAKGDMDMPRMKYDPSVNDAQRILFENILDQEYKSSLTQKIDVLQRMIHGNK
ncbi:MAG: hypothetical protein AABY40_03620, partial [Nanoarchaeota archaeon]